MPLRHSDSGFTSTRNSDMLMSFGSVPSSGRPVFDVTLATSGDWRIAARMRWFNCCASVTETLVGRNTFTQIAPSFSSGRNSVPRRGTSARLAASATTAAMRTARGRSSAQTSAGA